MCELTTPHWPHSIPAPNIPLTVPSSLNCPTCGAAAAPDASRCDFCGSALTAIACPSCFAAVFAGTKFCPHCGAAVSREALEEDAKPFPCPGCRAQMRSIKVGVAPMRECPTCTSVFIDAENFTKLCTNREDRGSVAQYVMRIGKPDGLSISKKVRYLPCPLCAKVMNRVNFGHRSGVVIDVCKGHGAWLEHGELQDVLAFIDQGGLERDRAMQQSELAMQQRKLEQDRSLDLNWVRPQGDQYGRINGLQERSRDGRTTLFSLLDMIDFFRP